MMWTKVFNSRMAGLLMLSGMAAAMHPGVACAQSHNGNGNWTNGNYGPSFPRGGLGFGASGVSIGVSQQGGVVVNIANVGSASSFYGAPFGVPNFGVPLSGIPGFSGGGIFNGGGQIGSGMNNMNINVGGGYVAPGGVSVNIANVALTNNYYFGNQGGGGNNGGQGDRHWSPPPAPTPPQDNPGDHIGGGTDPAP